MREGLWLNLAIVFVSFWVGYLTAPRGGITVIDQRGCEEPALRRGT